MITIDPYIQTEYPALADRFQHIFQPIIEQSKVDPSLPAVNFLMIRLGDAIGCLMLADRRSHPCGRWWLPIPMPERTRILEDRSFDRYLYRRFGTRLAKWGYTVEPCEIAMCDEFVLISFTRDIAN